MVDCVLLDLALPDARDLDALRPVLDSFDAPVVVLTGFSDHDLGVAAVAAGAEDYLAKNEVDPALLERSIRYAIERHRTRDTARQLLETELRREENLRLERGLLPRPLLDDAGSIATTRYRAGGGNRVIGGDFFDTVERADGSVRAVIGDVCGHGPDEAALGVNMRIAWRTLVLAEVDDESVLPMLERLLVVERGEDLFVTVCDATVSADRRRVEYRLAGHPAPLVIEGDTVEEVAGDDRGVPLGVIADGRWPTRTREVSTPWTFLMFTDGLFEGRRGAGPERLGVEGLHGPAPRRPPARPPQRPPRHAARGGRSACTAARSTTTWPWSSCERPHRHDLHGLRARRHPHPGATDPGRRRVRHHRADRGGVARARRRGRSIARWTPASRSSTTWTRPRSRPGTSSPRSSTRRPACGASRSPVTSSSSCPTTRGNAPSGSTPPASGHC